MPRNAQKKHVGNDTGNRPPTPAGRRAWGGDIEFLNVVLSEGDKLACSHWISGTPPVWDIVDGLISEGYKFSSGLDARSGAVMATITDRREGSQHINKCFTLRGRDFATALLRVCWTHAVLLDGNWDNIADTASRGDVW
jgi:hypothetical protein